MTQKEGKKLWCSVQNLLARTQRLQKEIERCSSVKKANALRDQLAVTLEDLTGHQIQIEHAIETVPDARLRLLLRYRYIDGMTIEEAANEMGISRQWISILQREALDQIQIDSQNAGKQPEKRTKAGENGQKGRNQSGL